MRSLQNARRARMVSVMVMFTVLVAALGVAATLSASPPVLTAATVIGPPERGMARFGQAIAAREGLVVVGAPTEGDAGNEPGAVAVARVALDAGGMAVASVEQILRSPRPAESGGDHFGASVALGRAVLAVGADAASVGDIGFEGAVEIFGGIAGTRRWEHQATLRSPRPQAGSEFGCVVAIAEDLLAVGARREDAGAATDAGSVHLFHRSGAASGWEWMQSLDAPAIQPSGWFGAAVAADGWWLAIGAPGESGGAGAVHLFARAANGRFSLLGTLRSPRPSPSAWFGAALAIDGSTLVVGEPRSAIDGARPGAAWVFELAWPTREPLLLIPPAPSNGMAFGQSVAIDSERVLVGAPGFDAAATSSGQDTEDCGRAYLFDRASLAPRVPPTQVLAAPYPSPMALCGTSAALLRMPAVGARRGVPAAVLGHHFIEEESPAPSPGAALYAVPADRSSVSEAPAPGPLSRRGTTCPACSSTGPPFRTR